MTILSRRLLGGAAAVTAVAVIMVPGTAFAKGGPPAGRGHGTGSSSGGETTTTNNLSVPTIMVGGQPTGVTCATETSAAEPCALGEPQGEPLKGYPVDPAAYYYVQGVNTWQARWYAADSAKVTTVWGANLTGGEAKLSTSSPIRVELNLFNAGGGPDMQGYMVEKLNLDALDRDSAYGTLATGSPETGFSATPMTFTPTQQRVYAVGVTFSVCLAGTSTCPVPAGTDPTAEINATGNIVYGYNLRVTTPGQYTIAFSFPSGITVDGTDFGNYTASSVTLPIDVSAGTGAGKGRGMGRGGSGGS